METLASNIVTVEDAKARWEELIARVGAGEGWSIINAAGIIVAKLEPAPKASRPETRRWKAFGMMKGQIEISPDFDEPLADFEPYME